MEVHQLTCQLFRERRDATPSDLFVGICANSHQKRAPGRQHVREPRLPFALDSLLQAGNLKAL